jgi:hypothetical protein
MFGINYLTDKDMGITAIFDFIVKNRKFIFGAAFVLIIALLLQTCNSERTLKEQAKSALQLVEQNKASMQDSIKKYKDREGNIGFKKAISEMSMDDLKKERPDLYAGIKAEGSGVKLITKIQYVFRDTGSTKNTVITLGHDKYALPFTYLSSDSMLSVKGESMFFAKHSVLDKDKGIYDLQITPSETKFSDISIKFGITTGIKKDKDGIDRIFVKPGNDKIAITNIEGEDVSEYIKKSTPPPSKKKFGIGPYVGYGVNFGANGLVTYGPSIGLCFSYSLIRF